MPTTRRERPPPKRRRQLRFWITAAALVIVFGIGLAIGESLHDNPSPGDTQTLVRTLRPLELSPARETVTVTVPR